MGVKKIIHVDDSALSRKAVKMSVCSQFKDIDYYQCDSFAQLKTLLEEKGCDISVILTDISMVGASGFDLLDWVKSHPLYHHIPVIVLSAEFGHESQKKAKQKGAVHFLKKPYAPEEIHHAISCYSSAYQEHKDSDFHGIFIEAGFETIEELKRLNENGDAEAILRNLHKLKGDALTSHWPIMAYFIHDLEDIWSLSKETKTTQSPQLHSITKSALEILANMLNDIKIKKPHRLPPLEVYENILHLKYSIEKGWASGISSQRNEKSQSASRESITQSHDSIRVPREKLDESYEQVKKISQIRNKMSVYMSQLKQELNDEPFINDLSKMINDLGTETSILADFILKVRAKDLKTLLENIKRTVDDTAKQLKTSASVSIRADENMLVDLSVLKLLESLFGHLIRNSLDHGLESKEDRIRLGKPEQGFLEITFALKQQQSEFEDLLVIDFRDDGSGIDLAKLRKKLLSLNLLSEEQVNSMNNKELQDYIFMDAVSTKEEASIFSGRGVGLSLLRKTLNELNGTITV
ncbi:MAG: response regulator, partial [Bdellovibrio sp.]